MTEDEKFFSCVKYSATGCWNWLGTIGLKGYGQFSYKGESTRTHRWSYKYFIGPIGKLHICHHCDNRKCVNPFHLFRGTRSDNMSDCVAKGRHSNTKKKVCIHGHSLSGKNLYITAAGKRACIACRRKRARDFYREHAGDKFFLKHLAMLARKRYWKKRTEIKEAMK